MTANDSDVSDGDILTGSQVVRVYGRNLTAPFVKLTFGDVEYTPLTQGEGYIEFILGDNGTYTISVDGSPFMSFEVEGIIVPAGLPTRMVIAQKNDTNVATIGINSMVGERVNCLNYPYIVTEEYPYYRFLVYLDSEADSDDYQYVNCNLESYDNVQSPIQTRMVVSVIDAGSPSVIIYKGFIVAVFNYPTT